jgi:hypothetical protein
MKKNIFFPKRVTKTYSTHLEKTPERVYYATASMNLTEYSNQLSLTLTA